VETYPERFNITVNGTLNYRLANTFDNITYKIPNGFKPIQTINYPVISNVYYSTKNNDVPIMIQGTAS